MALVLYVSFLLNRSNLHFLNSWKFVVFFHIVVFLNMNFNSNCIIFVPNCDYFECIISWLTISCKNMTCIVTIPVRTHCAPRIYWFHIWTDSNAYFRSLFPTDWIQSDGWCVIWNIFRNTLFITILQVVIKNEYAPESYIVDITVEPAGILHPIFQLPHTRRWPFDNPMFLQTRKHDYSHFEPKMIIQFSYDDTILYENKHAFSCTII